MVRSIGSSKLTSTWRFFFFFTTTVSVTDQFWLIIRRFDWPVAVNFPFFLLPFPTQRHSTGSWYNKSDNFFKDFRYLVFIEEKK